MNVQRTVMGVVRRATILPGLTPAAVTLDSAWTQTDVAAQVSLAACKQMMRNEFCLRLVFLNFGFNYSTNTKLQSFYCVCVCG